MTVSALANRALLIKLIAAAATYGFTILLARTMLPSDFGKIAFFLNLALILSVVGARGQQMAALRYVPHLIAAPVGSGLSAYGAFAIQKAAVGTLVVLSLTGLATSGAIAFGWAPALSRLDLALGLALIPLVGWIDLQSHWARASNLLGLSLIPKDILWRAIAGTAIFTLFLVQGRGSVDVTQVLFCLVTTLVRVAAVQAGFLLSHIARLVADFPAQKNPVKSPAKSHAENPDWPESVRPFWITSVSNIFLGTADVVIVGILVGPTAAGFYFAANRLAMLLSFFAISYNIVLAPTLTLTWQSGSLTQTAQLIQNATLKISIPTVVAGAILAVFAPQFLGLFGPDFSSASTALRLLILAAVLNAIFGPADIALNMCGFHQKAMQASAVSLLASGVFLTIGAQVGGIDGVAMAVLISTTLRKGLFWWLAKNLMAIRTDILASRGQLPRLDAVFK